jgi:hypothetical protein
MSEHRRIQNGVEWMGGAGRAVLCLLLFTAAGCQSGEKKGANTPATAKAKAPATDRYKVTADTTPFYTYGPQEPNGPDDILKKDTKLTLLQRSYGYSRVTTPDGKSGYVGTEDIGPLSAEDLADENAAVQLMPADAEKRLGPMPGGYTIPPEAGNDERLPVSDAPTPTPAPATPFHF